MQKKLWSREVEKAMFRDQKQNEKEKQ